jgi:phosphoribosylglycinamide formyltransferase 1
LEIQYFQKSLRFNASDVCVLKIFIQPHHHKSFNTKVYTGKPNKNLLYYLCAIMVPSIIIFASGGGSNAIAIHQYAIENNGYKVACIISNKPDAGILQYASQQNIPTHIITKASFADASFLQTIQKYNATLIVLAGFLWLIPPYLLQAYPNAIVNIHPSLLPKYGGAGMYGMRVHEAVVANSETESGITIHVVNEEYDKGRKLFQVATPIAPTDSAQDVASKVLSMEHIYYKHIIQLRLDEILGSKKSE